MDSSQPRPRLRTAPRPSGLSTRRMSRVDVFRMIKRRVKTVGLGEANCNTSRATGITAYLLNGGTLERAQAIAAHEPRPVRSSGLFLSLNVCAYRTAAKPPVEELWKADDHAPERQPRRHDLGSVRQHRPSHRTSQPSATTRLAQAPKG